MFYAKHINSHYQVIFSSHHTKKRRDDFVNTMNENLQQMIAAEQTQELRELYMRESYSAVEASQVPASEKEFLRSIRLGECPYPDECGSSPHEPSEKDWLEICPID